MEQGQLLSLLKVLLIVLLSVYSLNTSFAAYRVNVENDMDFAKDLARRSRQMSMKAIKKKWLEMKKDELSEIYAGLDESEIFEEFTAPVLKIFVSNSMGISLLKSYVEMARKYRAVLIFKGLPNGSWRELSDLIYEITEGEDTAIQLDDLAFNEYEVKSVPTFVLAKEESVFDAENSNTKFDKIVGNIGIRRALEEISSAGELAEYARLILRESR